MALTINTNSYVDITYATTYFSERLYTTEWDNADSPIKEKALIQATRWIDMQTLKGTSTVSTQTLHFPIDSTTNVPEAIKMAVCEKALSLLKQGDNIIKSGELKSVNIDGVSESYVTNLDIANKNIKQDVAIMNLLRPYLSTVVSIVR